MIPDSSVWLRPGGEQEHAGMTAEVSLTGRIIARAGASLLSGWLQALSCFFERSMSPVCFLMKKAFLTGFVLLKQIDGGLCYGCDALLCTVGEEPGLTVFLPAAFNGKFRRDVKGAVIEKPFVFLLQAFNAGASLSLRSISFLSACSRSVKIVSSSSYASVMTFFFGIIPGRCLLRIICLILSSVSVHPVMFRSSGTGGSFPGGGGSIFS